jgi:pSer/pThr/pTyr-binding forkhead associated (FHA) protein
VLWRTAAIAPMGALLGLAVGLSALNLKKSLQGLVGGIVGGVVSGLAFDPIAQIFAPAQMALSGVTAAEVGAIPRALTCALVGGVVAFCIGIVERVTRSAWLRLELGRNEGKEWPIDGSRTVLGRSERVDVPLFGDPSVAEQHCAIDKTTNGYVVQDGGSPTGTFLNGQRVTSSLIQPGDVLQIGGFRLIFLTKNVPHAPRAVDMGRPQMPAAPMSSVPMSSAPMGAPVTGQWYLVPLDGPLLGQRFPLIGPIEIGREGANLQLAFDSVASRRHATLAITPQGIVVTDLGSTNGTFLNGQKISQAVARPHDQIKIGITSFRIEFV